MKMFMGDRSANMSIVHRRDIIRCLLCECTCPVRRRMLPWTCMLWCDCNNDIRVDIYANSLGATLEEFEMIQFG